MVCRLLADSSGAIDEAAIEGLLQSCGISVMEPMDGMMGQMIGGEQHFELQLGGGQGDTVLWLEQIELGGGGPALRLEDIGLVGGGPELWQVEMDPFGVGGGPELRLVEMDPFAVGGSPEMLLPGGIRLGQQMQESLTSPRDEFQVK